MTVAVKGPIVSRLQNYVSQTSGFHWKDRYSWWRELGDNRILYESAVAVYLSSQNVHEVVRDFVNRQGYPR